MNCSLCQRVEATHSRTYPYFIHEFTHSFLMLGEHQYFPGYCVLVLKSHFKEMTNLPAEMRVEFMDEMMKTSEAIERAFKPTKMNMCSLGNVVPHVHWHFFPRYQTDPEFQDPPWLRMHLFSQAKVSPAEAQQNINKIRLELARA